jgi:hypothetical protein
MKIPPDRKPQLIALACGVVGFACLVFAFNYIDRMPVGDGSGFKWLLAVPATGIFLFLCLPGLILAAFKRTAKVAIGFGMCGILANAFLLQQMLAEFGGK